MLVVLQVVQVGVEELLTCFSLPAAAWVTSWAPAPRWLQVTGTGL